MLQEGVAQFWIQMPKFSQGWLSAFKKRYRIKKCVLAGELGSMNDGEETQILVREIQEILGDYEGKDIYNMDETGL